MRLLLVEDNIELSKLLTGRLRSAGFEADTAGSAEAAGEALRAVRYSAMVLDLGLPDLDGLSVLQELRKRKDPTPVLVLTARGGVGDRIKGLQSGADDYLVKPFDFGELVARLQALLRRPSSLLGPTLQVGNVKLDTELRQVTVDGVGQALAAREVAVLELLMRRSGLVMPKKLLEDQMFGHMGDVQSNAIEVNVHRVRKQLAAARANLEIHTIRGVGYLLAEKRDS